MKNECECAESKDCLCDVCKSMRKALEEVEKISKEEIEKMFEEADKLISEVEQWEN